MQKLIITISILTSCFLLPTIILAHGDEHGELIIRMTDNGFEPKELTVTEGDEVLFINNDDTDRWPASNFHPTHTLDRDFDPLKGIPPGSSWKHTFSKVGTWRMHDHLIPHFTGTIVVLEDPGKTVVKENASSTSYTQENPVGFWAKIKVFFLNTWQKMFSKKEVSVNSRLLAEFKNQDERAKYAWLENIAEEESPEAAWRYVKAAYNTPQGVVGNPHDMAHLVGQLIYDSYGFEGLSICEPIFAFGCYHGLMELAFDKDKPAEYENRLLEAQDGCQILGDSETPSYWSCIHGMGHGVASFREYDLGKSLEDCDLLDERVRTYCHDGVFMEFSANAPANFYKKNDPIYPCDVVGVNYKRSCARYQAQVMRLRFHMDTNTIASVCLNTLNKTIIYHCTDALGYFIAQNSQGNASKIILDCQDIKNNDASAQCMAAAAGELVFQDYVGWQESVKQICDSLSGQYQGACQERIESVKKSYGRS